MEIKRTEKAFQISETQNSETNSVSSKKVSTLSTSDSFENANSNQRMFAAPQPESPLSKTSESLERQFNATRIGQSMIGTSSPQPVSRAANDKQAELTKAHTEFKERANAPAQDPLSGIAEHFLDGVSGGSDILGGGFTPVTPDFLFDQPGRETTTENPPKPEPTLATEINQKQKFFNDLLESNRMRPTSSERDEKSRNVKDHNNVQTFYPPTEPTSSVTDERIRNVNNHNNVQSFYPSIEPTSRANDKQAEFTVAKESFDKTLEEKKQEQDAHNLIESVTDLINDPYNSLEDKLAGIDPFKEKESTPIAESNHKQKQLTDLLASTREALKK
jgi:hypothetical protein